MAKFSSKYLNESNVLKHAYLGFEFEFYTKNNIPYYKLLEKLNNLFRDYDIRVEGIRKYHPNTKPTPKKFLITPDFSGGLSLVELITGKLHYHTARGIMLKILNFIKENGYTNEKCSIHLNISFDEESEKSIEKINKLKMILNTDEELVYEYFPERENSFYAKSVKKIIPFKQFNYSNDAVKIIQSNLELPENDRYYGINFLVLTDGRIEIRYLGGENYEEKTAEILELLDYFIILSWNSIDASLNDDDIEQLEDYLNQNINQYKNFNKLENFIGSFPTIKLEVDRNSSIPIVNVYYGDIYDELFDLISNTYNLSNCTINYDIDNKIMEVVDATIKGIFDINNWTFVDCTINGGVYHNCRFVNCTINNTHMYKGEMESSEIFNTRMTNSEVDKYCTVSKSFLYGGYLNGDMTDGVLRLTKVGEDATLGDDVKILTDVDDFFNIRKQREDDKKGKEKVIEPKDYGDKKLW